MSTHRPHGMDRFYGTINGRMTEAVHNQGNGSSHIDRPFGEQNRSKIAAGEAKPNGERKYEGR